MPLTLNDVAGLVGPRIEALEKEGRISLFPKNDFFKKVLGNSLPGGGDQIQVPVTVVAPEASESQGDLIPISNEAGDTQLELYFPYTNIKSEATLSQLKINKISGHDSKVLGYVDQMARTLSGGYNTRFEDRVLNGTGVANTFVGLKSIFTGLTYGGVTRAETVQFGTQPAVSVSTVLGNTTVFEYGSGALDPTRINISAGDHFEGIEDDQARLRAVRKVLGDVLQLVSRSGHKADFIVCADDVYSAMLDLIDSVASPAQMGVVTSLSATGDKELYFRGAKFIQNDKLAAGEAMVLNTDFLFSASVNGFGIEKPNISKNPSPQYVDSTLMTLLGSGGIVTDAPVRHAFISDLLVPYVTP